MLKSENNGDYSSDVVKLKIYSDINTFKDSVDDQSTLFFNSVTRDDHVDVCRRVSAIEYEDQSQRASISKRPLNKLYN